MPLRVRIGRQAVAWLAAHSELIPAFGESLSRVRADELSLLRWSEPLQAEGRRHVQRFFRFGENCIGVFEWTHVERSIHVHTCRLAEPPNRAA